MFGLAFLVATTNPLAYQDIASLLVSQPGVAERARTFLIANSLGTLKAATFSLPTPLASIVPDISVPDHFQALNASALRTVRPVANPEETSAPRPRMVNRSAKADRLVPLPVATVRPIDTANVYEILPESADEDFVSTELDVIESEPVAGRADTAGTVARNIDPLPSAGALTRVSRLFFGVDDMELPPLTFQHRTTDAPMVQLASLGSSIDDGTSVAPKGVVTGDEAQPKTPAERLGLTGAKRKKAEKCLADAIYFESRGEPERGQVAVAQVVINRVFSGFYPEDVCGTVYQNAHRHLACQFTFACEGKKLVVNDKTSWARATRIAADMLDGKEWLDDVGKATHYHASWVRPRWISGMRRIQKIGVHTFYRPRAWKDS